jgi:hypothetical protein
MALSVGEVGVERDGAAFLRVVLVVVMSSLTLRRRASLWSGIG